MKIVRGNLWDTKDKVIIVTTNSYINAKGRLVMGRGAALECATRHPEIPKLLGEQVDAVCGHLGKYGAVAYWMDDKLIGAFQVKYHFKWKADLDLIKYSTEKWCGIINDYHNGLSSVSMNFPGIGWGGLNEEDVLPIIEQLPDSVTIWRYYD